MASKAQPRRQLIPAAIIERRITILRGHKILLDAHLAELYDVETRILLQAVKRNRRRFPPDFMFQLTSQEHEILRSHFVISSSDAAAHGGRRYRPFVFTEQGVAMLSSVLKSERAVAVNIAIIRTFVRLRQILATHKQLAERLSAMEKKYDGRFKVVFDALRQLLHPPEPTRRPIGFLPPGLKSTPSGGPKGDASPARSGAPHPKVPAPNRRSSSVGKHDSAAGTPRLARPRAQH
jgi:phage regulator Rha-like protein